jgi:hypothetical protein
VQRTTSKIRSLSTRTQTVPKVQREEIAEELETFFRREKKLNRDLAAAEDRLSQATESLETERQHHLEAIKHDAKPTASSKLWDTIQEEHTKDSQNVFGTISMTARLKPSNKSHHRAVNAALQAAGTGGGICIIKHCC